MVKLMGVVKKEQMSRQSNISVFLSSEESDLSSLCDPGSEVEMDTAAVSEPSQSWPSCWDRKTWNGKKRDYPWLVSNNEKLGCSVCIEVASLGCNSEKSEKNGNQHLLQLLVVQRKNNLCP